MSDPLFSEIGLGSRVGLEPNVSSVDPLLMCEVQLSLGQNLHKRLVSLNHLVETSLDCVRPDYGLGVRPSVALVNREVLGPKVKADRRLKMVTLP